MDSTAVATPPPLAVGRPVADTLYPPGWSHAAEALLLPRCLHKLGDRLIRHINIRYVLQVYKVNDRGFLA